MTKLSLHEILELQNKDEVERFVVCGVAAAIQDAGGETEGQYPGRCDQEPWAEQSSLFSNGIAICSKRQNDRNVASGRFSARRRAMVDSD